MKFFQVACAIIFGVSSIASQTVRSTQPIEHLCNMDNRTDMFEHIRADGGYLGKEATFYSGFEIDYKISYKLVTNKFTKEIYVLYCHGTPKPEFDNITPTAFFEVPLEKIAVSDQARPVLAWMEILELRDKISYLVGNKDKVTTPCISKAIDMGLIGNHPTFDNSKDYPLFVSDATSKKDNNTITVSYNDLEKNALSRAEWIVFIAAFFNMERKADEIDALIKLSYQKNYANLKNIPNKKIIGFTEYEGILKHPKGWELIKPVYYLNLAKAASANLFYIVHLFDDAKSQFQEFQDALFKLTLLIDTSNGEFKLPKAEANSTLKRNSTYYHEWMAKAKLDVAKEESNELPWFVRAKKMFNFNKRMNAQGYNDFDESSVTRPDLMLLDLIYAQYPDYDTSYKPTWLLNFAQGEVPSLYSSESCVENAKFVESIPKTYKNGYLPSISESQGPFSTITGVIPPDSDGLNPIASVFIVISILLVLGLLGWFLLRRYKNNNPQVVHKLRGKFPVLKRGQVGQDNGRAGHGRNPSYQGFEDKFYLLDANNDSTNSHSNRLQQHHYEQGYNRDLDQDDLGPAQTVNYSLGNSNRF